MKTKFAICEKCKEVIEYDIFEDDTTTFPRGELIVHQDYITTGLQSREYAEYYLTQRLANISHMNILTFKKWQELPVKV